MDIRRYYIAPIAPVWAQRAYGILYGGFITRRYTLVHGYCFLRAVSYRVYRVNPCATHAHDITHRSHDRIASKLRDDKPCPSSWGRVCPPLWCSSLLSFWLHPLPGQPEEHKALSTCHTRGRAEKQSNPQKDIWGSCKIRGIDARLNLIHPIGNSLKKQ